MVRLIFSIPTLDLVGYFSNVLTFLDEKNTEDIVGRAKNFRFCYKKKKKKLFYKTKLKHTHTNFGKY